MPKGSLLTDTFEKLAELGASTAKKTVKSVAQTMNPLSAFDNKSGEKANTLQELSKKKESAKGKNHTPLDFDKLKDKFQDKEKIKMEGLRNRLFNMVKSQDERMLMAKRHKEIEKKRQETYADQEKKRKEEEKKKMQDSGDVPRGRVRKSIFSSKKTADRQHAEVKPASSKQ